RAFLTMAVSGFRLRAPIGLHIAMVVGFGNLIMDGHGFPTSRGVGRRTTMAGGFSIAAHGAGGRARYGCTRLTIRCGRRLTYPSSASTTVASDSALASATSAGCLLGLGMASTPGMAATETSSTSPTLPTLRTSPTFAM